MSLPEDNWASKNENILTEIEKWSLNTSKDIISIGKFKECVSSFVFHNTQVNIFSLNFYYSFTIQDLSSKKRIFNSGFRYINVKTAVNAAKEFLSTKESS